MASSDGKIRKGDIIVYTAEVSNEGNTCLIDVAVTDLVVSGGLDCGACKLYFEHTTYYCVHSSAVLMAASKCTLIPPVGRFAKVCV